MDFCSPWRLASFWLANFSKAIFCRQNSLANPVGLHPVWLIFALLAFGCLFGFTGLIIAVPFAAAAGVILRFAVRRYRESNLYTSTAGSDPGSLSNPACRADTEDH